MRSPKSYLRLDTALMFRLAAQLGAALEEYPPVALGYLTRLMLQLAGTDGVLAGKPALWIGGLACYPGDQQRFAAAVLDTCCDAEGVLIGWPEATVEQRRQQRERARYSKRKTPEPLAFPRGNAEGIRAETTDPEPLFRAISAPNPRGNEAEMERNGGDYRGGEVSPSTTNSTSTETSKPPASNRRASTRKRKAEAPVETWVTPYAGVWQEVYGGDMPIRRNVAVLAELEDRYGAEETLRRWGVMLRRTPVGVSTAHLLKQGWGTFGLEASAGGKSPIALRAAKLLDMLVRHGITSCPPDGLRERIQRLEAEGVIRNAEAFVAILQRLDFAVIREARVPAFAIKHIEERASDLLAS